MSPHSRILYRILCLVLICFTGCAAHVSAQQCTLKIDQLPDVPELRGFRLGMTFEQVKARVPQVQFGPPDEAGVTKTSINPLYDPRFDQKAFADIRTISFNFLDGRLTTVWIGYESSFKWQTVDEFVAGISKSLNVTAPWTRGLTLQRLHCDGFWVLVSLVAGSPTIRLSDDAAEETIAKRREEAVAAAEARVTGDRTTKLYYPSDCEAAQDIPAPNRVVFKDKDEAEKAGYKLAKDCQ